MTKPEWDRHSILAELRRRNMSLLGLAEHYGLAESGVRNIWLRSNEKVERAIADFIGEPVELLFAERYPKTGNRILKKSDRPAHRKLDLVLHHEAARGGRER